MHENGIGGNYLESDPWLIHTQYILARTHKSMSTLQKKCTADTDHAELKCSPAWTMGVIESSLIQQHVRKEATQCLNVSVQ